MPQYDHKEVGKRIVVHRKYALDKGYTTCSVCTLTTDIVVILIRKVSFLAKPVSDGSHPGRVAFGTEKNFMCQGINAICHALGKDRSTALPVFHKDYFLLL